MKILKTFLILCVCVVICISSFTACADELDHAPSKISSQHKTGDVVELNESYFRIEDSFEPSKKVDGYISSVLLTVDVKGYDADYTYFDCCLIVTWSYLAITDTYPSGKQTEHSVTVKLDANGDGSYSGCLSLKKCRGISNVEVSYDWCGSATRL